MSVATKEAPVFALHRDGVHPTFESQFDPCEEPQPTKVPGEGNDEFQPIEPHKNPEFLPSMRYDPSSDADRILKNGRHP